jgi:uncharacterized repeat protein (TIGR03803 family)
MRSANIRLRALQWTFSVMLVGALSGCHWDLFGGDSSNSASNAPAAVLTVGGTVSGLASGEHLVLLNNNSDSLSIAANGAFTFATALPADASYAVTTGTQPAGQACTVTGGVGTIGAANVTSVVVTCSDQAFPLGGTIQGLVASGLILANGSTTLAVPSGAQNFTFPAALAFGGSYDVTVSTQPTDFFCKISASSGTMPANGVTNIVVTCFASAFTLGGTIQGLTGSGLILANGSATVTVPSGASTFTFPTLVAFGSSYDVTVRTQPTGFACTVSAGSGTMPSIAVASVVVSCTLQSYTVGGTITGLGANTGLVLGNGADTLIVPANATEFTMPTSVASGAQYNVTITGHSLAMRCSLTNGTGVIAGANVTNITVACTMAVASVLYSFAGPPSDGAEPWWESLLLAKDGNFYGMTTQGGSNNSGTVFRVTPAGVETVLWSFGSGNDGSSPYGSLIQGSDGNFYGMTNLGGSNNSGTVFKITPAGVETVLWSFGEVNNGYYPYASLIQGGDGNFYGTTYAGGVYGYGTIFKITPAGAETVLWSFGNGSDGSYPYGNLIFGNDGNFYGMTDEGGVNGKGAIFKITPAGTESVLWSFGDSGDGANPMSSLILGTDGNFYGMTVAGGANALGAVFKITPGGAETVLHSFGNPPDGYQPDGSLIQGPDGNFYGTTELGGASNGTIFQVTSGGAETVLWSFGSTVSDGLVPRGNLILGPGGGLYCMTQGGGAHNLGTVIAFK